MRTSDIFIKKSVLCVFDVNLPFVNLTEFICNSEDEQGKFVFSLISKYFDDITGRKGVYTDEDPLGELLAKGEDPFESFVTFTGDEIHHMMAENPEIRQGSGIFLWAVLGEEEYIIFFKLNYQAGFICQVNEEGLVSWKKNNKVIPGGSKKCNEYLFINLSDQTVRVSDFSCYVDGEKVNYLATRICRLEPKKSEKQTVEAITDAIAATIEEKYEEKVPEKLMESKKIVADIVEEKGMLSNRDIQEFVFADNTDAADRYMEKVVEERLPKEPVYVSNKMEKRLTKKQKIVTESGIEILVPVEYLRDTSVFEYVQDETGKVCMMIKEVGKMV